MTNIHDYIPRHRDPPATRLFQLESLVIRLLKEEDSRRELVDRICEVSPRIRDALNQELSYDNNLLGVHK